MVDLRAVNHQSVLEDPGGGGGGGGEAVEVYCTSSSVLRTTSAAKRAQVTREDVRASASRHPATEEQRLESKLIRLAAVFDRGT